jgi:hypothetical protein
VSEHFRKVISKQTNLCCNRISTKRQESKILNNRRIPYIHLPIQVSEVNNYILMKESGLVFISYRRSDSIEVTGRIYDYLERDFGREVIFKDLDSIPPGIDFRKHLDKELAKCDIFIAVIGNTWLQAQDQNGSRRIDNPNDWVRLEIKSALRRNIPVIPLLVSGATLPQESELPDDIKDLASRNTMNIRPDPDFRQDINRLIRFIKSYNLSSKLEDKPRIYQPSRMKASSSNRVNPFEYGSTVSPDRFYGQHNAIADVRNRIGAVTSQCINIVGQRKSGKSSFLRLIDERVEKFCLPEQKPLIILLDLHNSRFHTPNGIIEGIRRGILRNIGKEPWVSESNENLFEIEDALLELRDEGYRLLVLLDHFESISKRLGEFQDWGEDIRAKASANQLTLVITSRQPISSIYEDLGLTSPFSNIFSTTILGSLQESDWLELIKSGFLELDISSKNLDKVIDAIDKLAGRLPFYTQMAASILWQSQDLEQARKEFIFQAYPRFNELWEDLEKSDQEILKLICDATQTEIIQSPRLDFLIRQGLVRPDGTMFSQTFAEFINDNG